MYLVQAGFLGLCHSSHSTSVSPSSLKPWSLPFLQGFPDTILSGSRHRSSEMPFRSFPVAHERRDWLQLHW